MTARRPTDTDPPAPAEPDAKEQIDVRPGYIPEVFKKRTPQTKGERYAAYQAKAHAPAPKGEDTQELPSRVLLDETRNDGFSGEEIRQILKEKDAQRARRQKTFVVEPETERSRSRILLYVLGAVVLLVLAVAAIVSMRPSSTTNPLPASATTTTGSAPTVAETAALSAASTVPTVAASESTAIPTAAVSSTASSASRPSSPTATAGTHAATSSTATSMTTHPLSSAAPSSSASSHHSDDWPRIAP